MRDLGQLVPLVLSCPGFWYGGKLVHDGKSTAGEVITSILTAFMAMNAFQTIVPQILILAKAHAAAVALQDLWVTVERGQRFRKRIDGLSPDVCQGLIQFKEASHSRSTVTQTGLLFSRFHSRILLDPITLFSNLRL